MRYQDRIYNQNGNNVRNHTIALPNTSSDICTFDIPLFTMTGGSKIDCVELICDLSGVSYNNVLTATTDCFITNELSGSCFNNIEWSTKIYEDSELVYSNIFYTSSNIGDVASESSFTGSVVTAFNSLGYEYSMSGTQYTLSQKGFKNLNLSIETEINYDDNCPLTGTSSGSTFTGVCSGDTEIVCNLNFNGLTSGDTNVHVITDQTTIPLDFTFTANTHSLTGGTIFKYDIHKYDKNNGYFFTNPIYTSEEFYWENFSGTSAFTASLPVNSIDLDGDYLVKGYYTYNACTEFANLNGDKKVSPRYKKGTEYSMYQPYKDFHFVSFTKADIPALESVETEARGIGALLVNSEVLDGTTNQFNIPNSTGGYIVSLNGITLSSGLDYNITTYSNTGGTTQPSLLTLSGDTEDGDILTYALTNNVDNNGVIFDGYEVESSITSGTTGNQGDETVYYNTTTGKYEFYTTYNPSRNNDVIVTLNGVTLANNIDYYLSTSVPNRIILEGALFIGDIINVFYNSNGSLVGNVFSSSFNVAWAIGTPPQSVNGVFSVEISDDSNFSNLLYTNDIDYVVNQIGYSTTVPLSGSVGDTQYYRVKNKKSYVDICGNPIITIAYSEVNEITIQTNAYNSY